MYKGEAFDVATVVQVRLPYTLTLLPTYKCTAACKHCCFQSNPGITHRVPQERLLRYIDDAVKLKTIKLVCISGGEAFTLGKDLVDLIQRCTLHGFMTRVVTNGYWAISEVAARHRLMPLIEAGLTEINFSTGDDHREFVLIERVVHGMAVAFQFGLPVSLMIEDRIGRTVSKELIVSASSRYPDLHAAVKEGIINIIESPWMEFSKDGDKISQHSEKLVNAQNVSRREPCKSVLTTVVVTPTEQLGMCCGLPREHIADLHVGSLREHDLVTLVNEGLSDFLKIWLMLEGPEKILAWAASKDSTIQWENLYAHNCDACRAMYMDKKVQAVIKKFYEEKLDHILELYALFLEGTIVPEQRRESRRSLDSPRTVPAKTAGIDRGGSGLIQLSV